MLRGLGWFFVHHKLTSAGFRHRNSASLNCMPLTAGADCLDDADWLSVCHCCGAGASARAWALLRCLRGATRWTRCPTPGPPGPRTT